MSHIRSRNANHSTATFPGAVCYIWPGKSRIRQTKTPISCSRFVRHFLQYLPFYLTFSYSFLFSSYLSPLLFHLCILARHPNPAPLMPPPSPTFWASIPLTSFLAHLASAHLISGVPVAEPSLCKERRREKVMGEGGQVGYWVYSVTEFRT
jgi:hypothetical protein